MSQILHYLFSKIQDISLEFFSLGLALVEGLFAQKVLQILRGKPFSQASPQESIVQLLSDHRLMHKQPFH